jgi:hypothetical protein
MRWLALAVILGILAGCSPRRAIRPPPRVTVLETGRVPFEIQTEQPWPTTPAEQANPSDRR